VFCNIFGNLIIIINAYKQLFSFSVSSGGD
jgi:hypothetical protein